MNVWEVLSMAGAFAVIALMLVLTYYASRWYARRMSAAPGSGRYIKFCDRVPVGQGSSLAIVQVGGKYYLLGISDKNMQLICELSDFEPEENGPETPPSFGRMFSDLLRKNRDGEKEEETAGAVDE